MNHTAALPDPDHTNPKHLRWAAWLLGNASVFSESWGLSEAHGRAVNKLIEALEGDAFRIERERAERDAATEKLIGRAVAVMDEADPNDNLSFRDLAHALDAAGLLRKADQ